MAIGYGCGMVFGVGMGCCVLLIGKPQWLVRMVGGQLNKKVKRKTRMNHIMEAIYWYIDTMRFNFTERGIIINKTKEKN